MCIYEAYRTAKGLLAEAQEEVKKLEVEIYNRHKTELNVKLEGTIKWEEAGHRISVVKKLTRTVDQEAAAKRPELFKAKYDFSKTHFNTLSPEQQKEAKEMITTKVGRPSFKVEVAE